MKANPPGTRMRAAASAVERARGQATAGAILGQAVGPAVAGKVGHIPPKWARHYHPLLALREEAVAERSGHALIASQPLEPYSLDMADAATDEFDRNVTLCKLSAEQDALYEIEAALKRIEQGTYGICELSGKRIPPARLRALPWTRFARETERQLELAGAIPSVRLGELHSVTGAGELGATETGEGEPEWPPSEEGLSRFVTATGIAAPSRRRGKRAKKPALARSLAGGRAKRQNHRRPRRKSKPRRK